MGAGAREGCKRKCRVTLITAVMRGERFTNNKQSDRAVHYGSNLILALSVCVFATPILVWMVKFTRGFVLRKVYTGGLQISFD